MEKFRVIHNHDCGISYWVEVDGFRVSFKGFEQFQFFAHDVEYGMVAISEVRTGRRVSDGESLESAKRIAVKNFRSVGVEGLEYRLQSFENKLKEQEQILTDPLSLAMDAAGLVATETDLSDFRKALEGLGYMIVEIKSIQNGLEEKNSTSNHG